MCTLLTGLPHNHTRLEAEPLRTVIEPKYVRRAEEYLAANAHRHVALPELAAAACVSIRTLTAAFRTHRGSSPMGFVREQRLDLARRRLLDGSGPNVTEVALSCGFQHLGRFSARYRARFGESPAETLRRFR